MMRSNSGRSRGARAAVWAAVVGLGSCAGAAAPILLVAPYASAITTRHDRLDSDYTELGNKPEYQAVGAFGFNNASGVLISPKWVLTAAHVSASGGSLTFNIGGPTSTTGTNYTPVQALAEPSYTGDLAAGNDIGLVRLNSAVTGINPASRYFELNEVTAPPTPPTPGTSVGFGASGDGSSPTGPTIPYGTKRAAHNAIDALGPLIGWNNRIVLSDFDDPGNGDGTNSMGGAVPLDTPFDLEGMTASGDSGGGTYISRDGRSYVAAIHSFIAAFEPPNGDGTFNSSYTDVMGNIRVSRFNAWIDDQIAHTWNTSSSGAFNSATNWGLGPTGINLAPGAGDIVGFRNPGTYTVTLPGAVTNHQLVSRGGNVTMNLGGSTYTLSSTMFEGALTVGRYSGNDAALTFTNGTVSGGDVNLAELAGSIGRLTIATSAILNANANVYVGGTFRGPGGAATLTLANSSSQLNVAGMLKVYAGGSVNYNAGSIALGALDVAGNVVLSTGANKVLRTQSLAVNGAGRINLTDNDMIASSATLAGVTALLTSGLTNGGAFDWNGVGISSSKAGADNAAAGSFLFGLGVILNNLAQVGGAGPIYTNFSGQSLTGNEILVKYTYFGDADLSGLIDATDYSLIDNGYVNTLTGWINGDFDYSGVIDATDYALIDNAYVNQAGPLADALIAEHTKLFGGEYVGALRAVQSGVIPEPAALGACALGATVFLARRRRRHR